MGASEQCRCDSDGFDICPEPTCPLYGRAVMVDHPHLDTPAARRRRERESEKLIDVSAEPVPSPETPERNSE